MDWNSGVVTRTSNAEIGRVGKQHQAESDTRPLAAFAIPIFTFVTDEQAYREMRASFEQAGFTEEVAAYLPLRSDGKGDPEPVWSRPGKNSFSSSAIKTCGSIRDTASRNSYRRSRN